MKLNVKISMYLFITLFAAMILFTLLILDHRKADMESMAANHVMHLADMVVASTRYTMLVNKRDVVSKIIDDIGEQKGIERIRVISAEGEIVHSKRLAELGAWLEKNDPLCMPCHQASPPLERIPDEENWKIVSAPNGRRTMSAMHTLRNEHSCSSASCHEHPPEQKILGIVEIAYSLDEIDNSIRIHGEHIVGISAGFILLISLGAGLLLHRLIYRPLKDLEAGAETIASCQLDQSIPVRNDDEFGHVAASFNKMTEALRESRKEVLELVESLEQTVAQRTQELRLAEAEVAQGEKLAAVGVLAAGIAHELNNPLTGVLTFTTLLRRKMADGSEDAEDLDLVIQETKRCASIIKRLLDFAREKVPVKGWFDINQVVEETVKLADRPASLSEIEIVTEIDPDLPRIWGDADLIKQVILNLVVNAQQAIETQGRITVQTRPCRDASPDKPGGDAARMIELVVSDTGCGIPEENLQRIFDPFFTSKEVGKGTGLGLSVSYGIISAHGGRISVDSIVGKGTTFHVLLPIAPPDGVTDHKTGENNHERQNTDR